MPLTNKGGEERLPAILQGDRLRPFISEELAAKSQPISFRTPQGVKASGYRAELLPEVCQVHDNPTVPTKEMIDELLYVIAQKRRTGKFSDHPVLQHHLLFDKFESQNMFGITLGVSSRLPRSDPIFNTKSIAL